CRLRTPIDGFTACPASGKDTAHSKPRGLLHDPRNLAGKPSVVDAIAELLGRLHGLPIDREENAHSTEQAFNCIQTPLRLVISDVSSCRTRE
ncbi:hypothetical protein, partial [Xanthomonas vasicola]|uniref:hypothetical protein n=1 Tax=Xanthomonas vasicola TaxID=56459 RepID=UPI001F36B932